MKTLAFKQWCDRLKLPTATRDFLARLPLYLARPTAEAYALLRPERGNVPFGWSDAAYPTTLYANAPLDWGGKRWTLYRALREKSPELTRAHLEKAVLPDAKWERMRADVRSGEAEFQYADGHNSSLSDLASQPTFVPTQPNSAPSLSVVPTRTSGTGDQKMPKPKRRPGEPSPRRDQVGTTEADRAVNHCSFPGPVQLDAMRWLESRVQEVQCPTCGSVSKARLKGSSVVIAPHSPQKARAVRNVTRWMEQGLD